MFNQGVFTSPPPSVVPPGSTVITIKDITWDDLVAGLNQGPQDIGFYNVTDRPNSGTTNLTVSILTNGKANASESIIQRLKAASVYVPIGDNTGLSGTFNLLINGDVLNSSPISFDGGIQSTDEIAEDIAANIDNPNYTAFSIGVSDYISSLKENGEASNGYLLTIENVSGDDLICTIDSGSILEGGGVFDHICNYNLAGDIIYWEKDGAGNIYYNNPYFDFNFPFDAPTKAIFNNFQQNGQAFLTNFVGFLGYNNLFNQSIINAAGSNANIQRVNIYSGSTLDIVKLCNEEQVLDCEIDLTGGTVSFNEAQQGLKITRETSNYRKVFTIGSVSTQAIDFAENNYCNWVGIVVALKDGSETNISRINGLDFAPVYFMITPVAGNVITIDNLGNIIFQTTVIPVTTITITTNQFVMCKREQNSDGTFTGNVQIIQVFN